ncbi:deoxycytidine triphosphate deaminase [Actinoplanes sp. Pm04-4]|uniref:Deoxycytidine triphosphate deaminase n=1 Tax=Paractinoplanes pyxinae TaxID=2997416 RepID=A0ABT4BC72_9ACTN|nr:deoxycytidine triphosphate deaminase [Actinoplanes pyxinae]MCY1144076.1 deoxycytidine triphosphate deaminase [Actinoplanes pyxinae]
MILTGPEIAKAIERGDITIDPFDDRRLSPNAYDWRLGDTIRVCDTDLDAARDSSFPEHALPAEGMVLDSGKLYLGVTHERTFSERYAQMINGDRTIGTLGVWVHVSAPLGHVGHAIRWTLEIRAARPVRIYPGMTFGKIVFLETRGELASYQRMGRKYTRSNGIDASRLHEELTSKS